MTNPRRYQHGFTSAELLLVLAMGAIIIGGVVVSLGSLIKNQPRVSSVVEAELGSKLLAYYGITDTTIKVTTAPNYGAVALAEKMREQFNNDVIGATAVFCLSRDNQNTYHPATIPYNPATDAIKSLDTPLQFRAHLVAKGLVTSTLFGSSDRNFSTKPNASIFVFGFSKTPGQLTVSAIYDVDVVKVVRPDGFYASVKRYTNTAAPQYYDVFYPPYDYNSSRWPTATGTTDGFTPIWVAFERSARAALGESSSDRFKKAAERPFYYIWWPDPGARDLRRQPNSYPTSDPRNAYNHQGGRTSFMFTVPMFPAL